MKVIELIQQLLNVDRDHEVVVSEFYAVPGEQNVLRIDHQIVGHAVDVEKRQVIFLIPNREGKIGNEEI